MLVCLSAKRTSTQGAPFEAPDRIPSLLVTSTVNYRSTWESSLHWRGHPAWSARGLDGQGEES